MHGSMTTNSRSNTQEAFFGAGCFWGVEEAFSKVPGVVETEVGFMGGHVQNPSYERVCRGDTGHAEVVRVVYDPNHISFEELLRVFWKIHDPTQYHAQGPDIGEQYRSVIFYTTEEELKIAESSRDQEGASGKYAVDIVTEIKAAGPFYRAEEYHQKYFKKMGGGSCHA